MKETRVVVVMGGDPAQRAVRTADLLTGTGETALLLTGHPDAVDPRLDTGESGCVEVRADDPTARLEAYRSGAVDPDDDVLAALSAGADTPCPRSWDGSTRAGPLRPATGTWSSWNSTVTSPPCVDWRQPAN